MASTSSSPEVAAWRDFCARLAAAGDALLGDEFPGAPADRADGFAHLAEQVIWALSWSVKHADPRRPAFQRQNDLVTRWGGPNADNVYRHARVEPTRRYRIRGHMHSCDDFILAVRAGFMHMDQWGTLVQVTASEVGIGRDEEFELLLGGSEPGAIALPAEAVMVSIREYYLDWDARDPARFTIECLDDDGPGPRRSGAELATQVAHAAEQVEQSMRYWNEYMRDARVKQPDNSFAPPLQVAKGLSAARYVYCFWNLAPGDALVVESDVPDARYWSLQLYNLGWFELFDLDDRITSRNQHQFWIGADGRLRCVIAADDPGVPNWLDTGGRPEGLAMFRWFWPNSTPSPSARVVPLAGVRDAFPPDTPTVDPAARARERRARLDHLARRFRT
jgi:hypothetical protein